MSAGTLHRTPEEYAAAPWDEADYRVRLESGWHDVEGVVCWPFAARWEPDPDALIHAAYNLTHLPSGRKVATWPTLDDCRRAARVLVRETGGTLAWWFGELGEAGDVESLQRAFAVAVGEVVVGTQALAEREG